ncbi:MAG: hypothetical protein WC841_02925 [Candidatus Shapirobacteria bacterium]|jgi:hypothetical protein
MNYFKILVPIAAVLVIAESIILFSGLAKKNLVVTPPGGDVALIPSEVVSNPDFSLVFAGESQMQAGKPSMVEVNMLAKNERSLDSLNLYVKYDPKSFDIDSLTFDPKLPSPTFSKVSTTKGMIVVNFLISDTQGMKLAEGDVLNLVSFEATPKVVGDFSFEVSTGNGTNESATMFVENATAKALPYSGSKLTIEVIK